MRDNFYGPDCPDCQECYDDPEREEASDPYEQSAEMNDDGDDEGTGDFLTNVPDPEGSGDDGDDEGELVYPDDDVDIF